MNRNPVAARVVNSVSLPVRLGVTLLAVSQIVVSLWQAALPKHFYDTFPTVALTPPYSEHLMRDFGTAGLGIAVVLTAAAAWPSTRLTLVALASYLVFSVPHLVFHASHLEHFSPTDTAFVLASVGGSVAVPVALVIVTAVAGVRERDVAARE